jgi:glycosyltransferase involved in cell wall biosynthesis
VTFAGFLNQSEIADAYIAADCLVLPSDFGETWGLVVNEAMCCNRPAIVSDRVGCWPDLVTSGETGAVFPFGDVGRLAAIMCEYAGRQSELVRMGDAAWHRVQEYSVERATRATIRAAEYACGRGA